MENGLTIEDMKEILQTNPGQVIVQFSADWCGPCKKIAKYIDAWYLTLPTSTTQIIKIDIDNTLELYAYLKAKKVVQGIPGIIMYRQGNTNVMSPDESISSSNPDVMQAFFSKCSS